MGIRIPSHPTSLVRTRYLDRQSVRQFSVECKKKHRVSVKRMIRQLPCYSYASYGFVISSVELSSSALLANICTPNQLVRKTCYSTLFS